MSRLHISYFTYAIFQRINTLTGRESRSRSGGSGMLIETRAIGFPLTGAIARHVESRLESALGPFSRWIVKATVRLDDVNANRGGVDKRCGVVVAMRRH